MQGVFGGRHEDGGCFGGGRMDHDIAVSDEMAQGGDASAFGLIQAMTHVAQGLNAPDQRFELERLAGRVLTRGDFGRTPAAVIATA